MSLHSSHLANDPETTHSPPQPIVSDPRYPIGRFRRPEVGVPLQPEELRNTIALLAELPEQLRNAVEGLDGEQLSTPYREGSWTVRQVIHHVADSHMHAFLRIRLALTEDWPPVTGYDQDAWAGLHDSATAPVEWSLELVESLHGRWVMLLQSLSPEQFQRGFKHAEHGPMTIDFATQLYAWHGRHHVAHITHLRAARGW